MTARSERGQAKPQTLQAIAQIGAPALRLLVHAAPMTALTAMDKLLFWLGLGAAQEGAGSKEVKPNPHWVFRSSPAFCLPC
jgi:hypothetical protein